MKNLIKTLVVPSLIGCIMVFAYYFFVSSQERSDFHNFDGRCEDCHVNIPKGVKGERLLFFKGITQICLDCHDLDNAISHPVDIIPSMLVPEDLHLDWEGRMTCATCHDIHQKKRKSLFGKGCFFLRRAETGQAFCSSCHYKVLEEKHRANLDTAHVGSRYIETDTENGIDRSSAECLGCHDDEISRHQRKMIVTGIWDHGIDGFSHPLGVRYPDPKSPLSRKEFVDITGLPRQIKLIDGKIGCITCHDPYSKEKGQLVISNKRGALCLACHIR
jgi:predicted CXXCH cytochrome family protein